MKLERNYLYGIIAVIVILIVIVLFVLLKKSGKTWKDIVGKVPLQKDLKQTHSVDTFDDCKKLCEKEGMIRDMKRNAYYEKPSEINRRRRRKAQRMALKQDF